MRENVGDQIVRIETRALRSGGGRLEDAADEGSEAITTGQQTPHTALKYELVYRDDQQPALRRAGEERCRALCIRSQGFLDDDVRTERERLLR